jgi:cytidylate kinase
MQYRNIVVAGDVGTGTTTLAKSLSSKLNWKYLSTGELYRSYVQEHNIPLWDHLSVPDEVDKQIDSEFIYKVKNEKNIVFDTHYGGYFSKDLDSVLRVLLICDPSLAEKRIIHRRHTHNENIHEIRKRRKENLKKFHKLYSAENPLDPKFFDLIIDTGIFSAEQTLKTLLKFLNK